MNERNETNKKVSQKMNQRRNLSKRRYVPTYPPTPTPAHSGTTRERRAARKQKDKDKDTMPEAKPALEVSNGSMRVEKKGRHWAVYDGPELVCVTVYRKGADEVARRLGHCIELK